MFYAITILSIVSLTLAAPTADVSSHDCYPTRELNVAKYDDLSFNDGGFSPIPPHYYGLSYTAFQVDQYDGWFPPTSGNQTAIAYGGSGNISIPDSYSLRLRYHSSAANTFLDHRSKLSISNLSPMPVLAEFRSLNVLSASGGISCPAVSFSEPSHSRDWTQDIIYTSS
jgi:hypothetical protein